MGFFFLVGYSSLYFFRNAFTLPKTSKLLYEVIHNTLLKVLMSISFIMLSPFLFLIFVPHCFKSVLVKFCQLYLFFSKNQLLSSLIYSTACLFSILLISYLKLMFLYFSSYPNILKKDFSSLLMFSSFLILYAFKGYFFL